MGPGQARAELPDPCEAVWGVGGSRGSSHPEEATESRQRRELMGWGAGGVKQGLRVGWAVVWGEARPQ